MPAIHRSRLFKACLLAAAALHSVGAAAQSVSGSAATQATPPGKEGSFYLQCDGNPNNMTAGESIARLIALSAVVGLLAPPPEQPDAAKRKFGAAGVAACSQLIDGERAEGNVYRRIPLILARALHRVEAIDYPNALADVAKARGEAAAQDLTSDPYFQRSMGLSLDLIEGEIRARMGDIAGAREVSLRSSELYPFNFYAVRVARAYEILSPDVDQRSIDLSKRFAKFVLVNLWSSVDQLSRAGRFEEAAALAHITLDETKALFEDGPQPAHYAQVAVADALAGKWDSAAELAKSGRDLMRQRAAEGKPEEGSIGTVERLDFYDVIRLAHEGDLKQARRSFGARSEWTAPYFGQILAVHHMLSEGIADDEKIGMLASIAESLWQTRRDTVRAVMLEADKGNKTLFSLILPYADSTDFERLSKRVWTTKGNRIIAKEMVDDVQLFPLYLTDGAPMTQYDALLLHAALQAKARGKQGLLFYANVSEPQIAFAHFANPGDPGVSPDRFLAADAVIAGLRTVIPPPEELAARKKNAR